MKKVNWFSTLLISFIIYSFCTMSFGQNNSGLCSAVPESIAASNFKKAAKDQFVYFGESGQDILLSDLIQNNCLPPHSKKKPVHLVFAGRFIIDTDYEFCKGSELIARSASQIIIKANVHIKKSYLHSCDDSWLGIDIPTPNVSFSMDRATKIEDTSTAVGVGSGKKKG